MQIPSMLQWLTHSGLAGQLGKVLHFLLASSDLLHSAMVDDSNVRDVEEDDFDVVLD